MDPIYNAQGVVIGWLDEDAVRNMNGEVVAWLRNDSVFGLWGAELANFSDGFFRTEGEPFAFIQGALSGPVLPVRSITPVRPVRHVRPVRPVFSIPSVGRVPSQRWSRRSYSDVIPGM